MQNLHLLCIVLIICYYSFILALLLSHDNIPANLEVIFEWWCWINTKTTLKIGWQPFVHVYIFSSIAWSFSKKNKVCQAFTNVWSLCHPLVRYLVVVDDLWKTSVWKTIQYALVDYECGSIIISTTRNLDVADKIGGVYRLQHLSLTDSRKYSTSEYLALKINSFQIIWLKYLQRFYENVVYL